MTSQKDALDAIVKGLTITTRSSRNNKYSHTAGLRPDVGGLTVRDALVKVPGLPTELTRLARTSGSGRPRRPTSGDGGNDVVPPESPVDRVVRSVTGVVESVTGTSSSPSTQGGGGEQTMTQAASQLPRLGVTGQRIPAPEEIIKDPGGIVDPEKAALWLDLPVTIEVAWRLTDERGRTLAEGTHYVAPKGLKVPTPDLLLVPDPVKTNMRENPPTATRFLHAKVRASTPQQRSETIEVPPAEIAVPALPIPTILALFVHKDLSFTDQKGKQGGVLIVAAPGTVLGNDKDEVLSVLQTLQGTLQPFRDLKLKVPWSLRLVGFLAGLGQLIRAINNAGAVKDHLQIRVAKEIPNLYDITYRSRWKPGHGRTARDSKSSLLLIGAPGQAVHLYNAGKKSSEQGQLDVDTGDGLYAKIDDLHFVEPPTEPTGRATLVKKPSGWNYEQARSVQDFGDDLSSLEFFERPGGSSRRTHVAPTARRRS